MARLLNSPVSHAPAKPASDNVVRLYDVESNDDLRAELMEAYKPSEAAKSADIVTLVGSSSMLISSEGLMRLKRRVDAMRANGWKVPAEMEKAIEKAEVQRDYLEL